MKYVIEQNNYKFQIAIKKPWYRSNSYYHKIIDSLKSLPNWRAGIENGVLIIDLYFNDKGWSKDDKCCRYESSVEGNIISITRIRNDILPNVKEFVGIK